MARARGGFSSLRDTWKKRNLWQRRFWEHRIRDEAEFAAFCDYVHFNPVKHGLCKLPTDWQWSSVYRFVQGDLSVRLWQTVNLGEQQSSIHHT